MVGKVIKRRRGEPLSHFAERVARQMKKHDAVDFGGGFLCSVCASFAGDESTKQAEISPGDFDCCYNCDGKNVESA